MGGRAWLIAGAATRRRTSGLRTSGLRPGCCAKEAGRRRQRSLRAQGDGELGSLLRTATAVLFFSPCTSSCYSFWSTSPWADIFLGGMCGIWADRSVGHCCVCVHRHRG